MYQIRKRRINPRIKLVGEWLIRYKNPRGKITTISSKNSRANMIISLGLIDCSSVALAIVARDFPIAIKASVHIECNKEEYTSGKKLSKSCKHPNKDDKWQEQNNQQDTKKFFIYIHDTVPSARVDK